MNGLQGEVAVLLHRQRVLLGGKGLQGADDAEAGVARLDDIVDVAVLGCVVLLEPPSHFPRHPSF